MGSIQETFKGLMRTVFIIGLFLGIDALIVSGDQPIQAAISGILSCFGVYFGWYNFEDSH